MTSSDSKAKTWALWENGSAEEIFECVNHAFSNSHYHGGDSVPVGVKIATRVVLSIVIHQRVWARECQKRSINEIILAEGLSFDNIHQWSKSPESELQFVRQACLDYLGKLPGGAQRSESALENHGYIITGLACFLRQARLDPLLLEELERYDNIQLARQMETDLAEQTVTRLDKKRL